MDNETFKLLNEDMIRPLELKLERISGMCNLESSEKRDIQNLVALISHDLENLSNFIQEFTIMKEPSNG